MTNATKAAKFKEIAERRTTRVLDALRLLGQCSNPRTYDYDTVQVAKIFREIRRALKDTELKFNKNKEKIRFRL
jgi:hypothetical protein